MPPPVPHWTWSQLSTDFIEQLHHLSNKDTILAVIDHFTKYKHFIALKHPFIAIKVAKMFFKKIHELHRAL